MYVVYLTCLETKRDLEPVKQALLKADIPVSFAKETHIRVMVPPKLSNKAQKVLQEAFPNLMLQDEEPLDRTASEKVDER
jgi:hypothetical protein